METLFELTFQDQTLSPQVGTFTDASQTTGTFTLEDGEYYLTNSDTKGFYAYRPVAMQSGVVDDSKVIIEFDLKVVTASANTHTIIGTYAGVDGSGIPTGAKITLQYNAGDIELVLGGGATATLIESADVVVDQWYHFRIDCTLDALTKSTYKVKIDGVLITTVTGATTDYALGIISVLGTDLHACDECGIKNITLVTETNLYVGRTALDQALQDVKGYVDNQVGACVPLAGSSAISGSLIPSTDNVYYLGSTDYQFNALYASGVLNHGTGNELSLGNTADGADMILCPKGYYGGFFRIRAYDGTTRQTLQGNANGTLTWNTKNVAMQEDTIPLAGSNQISGSLIPATDNSIDIGSSTKNIKMLYTKGITIDGAQFSPSDYIPRSGGAVFANGIFSRTVDDGILQFDGGSGFAKGSSIMLSGKDVQTYNEKGRIYLHTTNGTIGQDMLLYADGTWTWSGAAVQLVSDQRLKQQITEIDDKLLDAWEDVDLVQFKYNDAVKEKSDNARLHTGYVVQQIDKACKDHNVDISAYGLYCHEEYPEETEEIEVEQADGTKTKETKVIREASEHYSLRYTEVYAVECMYLRRCIERLTARIEELEKGKEQEASK